MINFSVRAMAAAAAVLLTASGCNVLTEAEEVTFRGDPKDDGTQTGGGADPHLPGPGKLVNCAYAPQTPGVAQSQQIPASKHWMAYLERLPTDAAQNLDATDLYDCNGTKGINAVVFETSQYGWAVCEQEAVGLEAKLEQYEAEGLGIKWVVLMVDDPDEGPPTDAGAKLWKDEHNLNLANVAADPGMSMIPPGGGSFGTPAFTIVDPRTMTVVVRQEGAGGHHEQARQLALQNKAPL